MSCTGPGQQSTIMTSALPQLPAQFAQAIKLIDHAHAQDQREAKNAGQDKVPHELHYARQMTSWLAIRCPEASPVLQVACRAQHFKRYDSPDPMFNAGVKAQCTLEGNDARRMN
jgi:hypothetical protein